MAGRSAATRASIHCRELVRKYDLDAYLCGLLLPPAAHNAYFVVRALNTEVARVRDSVDNVTIGQMRMMFWRNMVDDAFKGKSNDNSVSIALCEVLAKTKLSKSWLKRLIDARDERLAESPFGTLDHAETYAENTQSTLIYLTLQALGIQNVAADHVASHVGKAIGIVTLLRSTPALLPRRRLVLPLDVLARHGVVEEDIFRGAVDATALSDAVFEIATRANDHLITARSSVKTMPQEAFPAMLPSVPADMYLKRLEEKRFNILDPAVGARQNAMLPLKLAWSAYRKVL